MLKRLETLANDTEMTNTNTMIEIATADLPCPLELLRRTVVAVLSFFACFVVAGDFCALSWSFATVF